MTESQPWDDEPEIEDETETDADESGSKTGSAEEMFIIAVTLSALVPIWWAFIGPVPKPILYLAGLWIMAATITSVAEVYAA